MSDMSKRREGGVGGLISAHQEKFMQKVQAKYKWHAYENYLLFWHCDAEQMRQRTESVLYFMLQMMSVCKLNMLKSTSLV